MHSVELRMPLSLGLSDIFFMIRWELWVLGEKTTVVKCPFHHIILMVRAVSMHYHC